jgi:hypothetical protein
LRLRCLSQPSLLPRLPGWQPLISRFRIVCVLLSIANRGIIPECRNVLLRKLGSGILYDDIIDVGADIPEIFEYCDTTPETDVAEWRLNILESSVLILQEFRQMHHRINNSNPNTKYWATLSKVENIADEGFSDKLVPFCLTFESLETCVLHVLFCKQPF